jgi:acetolactate decarboxylase
VPGYHLHFLSADRKTGGHVLDFRVVKAKLEIDDTGTLTLMLPDDKEFYAADLTADREQAVKAVEK